MRWIEHFDLFLLDLDGLLVDTERLHFQAYQAVCRDYGVALDWDLGKYLQIAHSSAEGLKDALMDLLQEKEANWDVLYAEKKKVLQNLLTPQNVALMPGVEALLKELSITRTKRCVATNSSKEQVVRIKQVLPILESVPMWITREDYEDPKPAPDAYLKAMGLLFDPGDRVIGFEDSLRGFNALKSAGAMPVLICDPKHPQMRGVSLSEVKHYSSFSAIPKTFRG